MSVTYTHPNGTATDTKPVKIHKIEFDVTDTAITAGQTTAIERATTVDLWSIGTEMSTDPKVKIKLDPTCPRKPDCAANHRTGWRQTMLTNTRDSRYPYTHMSWTCPMPIRDNKTASATKPFYDPPISFSADQLQLTVHP